MEESRENDRPNDAWITKFYFIHPQSVRAPLILPWSQKNVMRRNLTTFLDETKQITFLHVISNYCMEQMDLNNKKS
jgi:hypothetical protein